MRFIPLRASVAGAFLATAFLLGITSPALAQDETQPCNPDGQLIAYGEVRAGCTIEVVADLDIFTFAASAGDDVRFMLTRTTATGVPCAEIRGPDNSVVVARTCGNLFLDPGPLPQPGIYQIHVTEDANNQVVDFNLSLERLFPLRNPAPIAYGQVLTDQALNPVTDLDTFQFNATAGDQVRIILTRTAGSALQCIELRAPNNTTVVPLTCAGIDITTAALPQTGTYQLVVTEQANNQVFVYNLGLTCVSGTCPDPPPACLVDPVVAGTTLTLNFTLGTAAATEWHVALLAFGQVFTFWTAPLPRIAPAVSFPLPIPNFPALGTIGFLSTFTSSEGLICTDLKTIDTGPTAPGATAGLVRRSLGGSR